MKKIIVLVVTSIALASCATIFCGSKANITIDSNVKQPTNLTIDGVKYRNVTFPYQVKIRRGFDETLIKAETEGFQPTNLMIYKNFNAVSILNLVEILGWGIDAATGAMMKPEFRFYELEFTEPVAVK